MAQETYRANLHSNDFPFFSKNLGETVILPRHDHTYARQLGPNQENTKDSGIPQAYYMHNVLPTEYGFQSVSYRQVFRQDVLNFPYGGVDVGIAYYPTTFLREYFHTGYGLGGAGVDGASIYRVLAPATYDTTSPWIYTTRTLIAKGLPFTIANVLGRNFYCEFNAGQIVEIGDGGVFTVRNTGLPGIVFSGICAAQGYLIGWTSSNVYWSSLTTPYDFTPSQITGAGGGSVSGIKGVIVRCVPTLNGFIIFGSANAVHASYTGNTRYPFSFTDVKNSSGISNGFAVTEDGHATVVYSLSKAGLQGIVGNQAETVVPDLSSFILNSQIETFDLATDSFQYNQLVPNSVSNQFYMKLAYVAKRYLCISYGRTEVQQYTAPPPILLSYYNLYEYILVYDTLLLRWGKLKIQHVCVFTFTEFAFAGIPEVGIDKIGVITPDGKGYVVDLAINRAADVDSVLILGKYQRDRGRFTNLHEVNVQLVDAGDTFSLGSYYTFDGLTKAGYQPGNLSLARNGVRKYAFDALNAYNHSIVLKGDFHVNTLVLTYTDGGDA